MPTRGSRLVSMTAPLASRLLEALRAHVRGDDVLVERVGEAVEVEVVDAGRAPLPAQASPVLHVLAVDDLVEVAVAGTRRLRREQLLELLEKRVEVRQLLRCEAAWRKVGRREEVVLRAIEGGRDRALVDLVELPAGDVGGRRAVRLDQLHDLVLVVADRGLA